MKVVFSSHYQQYTGGQAEVEASGGTVGEVMKDLDHRFPGIRFRIVDEQDRIRRHVNMTVGERRVKKLKERVPGTGTLFILGALSGG